MIHSEVQVAQSYLTLCDPMDYGVHGILQARILEWRAFPFSRESSQPRDQTQVSCSAGRFCASRDTREAHILHIEVFYLIYDVSVKSPKAAVTKCDKMGRLTNRTILSHSSGDGKSKIKVSEGLAPSEGCKWKIFSQLLSLTCKPPSSPCVSSHCLPSMCVFRFPSLL